ncbi:MAG TPA: FHA domain-containing protein [Verrucomicrobiae bacterium]
MNTDKPDSIIQITKDDAMSTHVDDMLKRQMSLRGDPGVTRDHKRAWYYQSWFVFGFVGMLGALAAWALLEPMFADYLYIQGKITAVDETVKMSHHSAAPDEEKLDAVDRSLGSVTVNGETILLMPGTKEILPDKRVALLEPEKLKQGDELGFYVRYHESYEAHFAVAGFVVPSPPPLPANQPKRTLHQLESRKSTAGMLLFPLVAGFIGLFIGAADGLVCRLPRRALLSGAVGLLVGFVGGFVFSLGAGIIYSPLTHLAMKMSETSDGLSATGFVIQIIGRSIAWCMAGAAMGLGQGIALRSKRLLLYGFLGGIVGGLLGGLLFDPIDLVVLGQDKPSAMWSRLIGFAVIGLSVGVMIGVVELLARDAWLRMTQGPLTGKEFLIFKDVMNVGSSPRSDIYLFNDPLVAEQHAMIRAVGDECEIEARQTASPLLLNNRSVTHARLRHGDTVTIGRTVFVFQQRKG